MLKSPTRTALTLLLAWGVWLQAAGDLLACPFCTPVRPPISQQVDEAASAFIGELVSVEPTAATIRVHRVLKGEAALRNASTVMLPGEFGGVPGSLMLFLGTGSQDTFAEELVWVATSLNEGSIAYVARAPSLKTPSAERLRYFVPYLEHVEPLIAEDAYLEFAHASYDDVARVADILPYNQLRSWIEDDSVRPERKGFYGMALGLAERAPDQQLNTDLLKRLILTPADDFRTSFDGLLGGYLMLTGDQGLELIEKRFLADPNSRDGDVRHVMTALRFYHEFGRKIPAARLQQAMAKLLDRPEFAAMAIVDLSRWEGWELIDRIAPLYDRSGFPQPATRRAVVGYLSACPLASASEALSRLEKLDPAGVEEAQQHLSLLGGAVR